MRRVPLHDALHVPLPDAGRISTELSMPHWLAAPGEAQVFAHIKRFDPRFWTVDFPRPMMASVVTTGPRCDAGRHGGVLSHATIWPG